MSLTRTHGTRSPIRDEQSLGLGAARRRMAVLALLVAALILSSVFQVFFLQTRENGFYAERAARAQVTEQTIYQKRGPIVDRSGNVLAQTIESCGLAVRRGDVKDLDAVVRFVGGLTGTDSEILYRKADCSGKFCYLVRNVSPTIGDAILDVTGYTPENPDLPDRDLMARKLALSGLIVEPEATRFYVGKELAGQILGFASFPDREYLEERGRRHPIPFELQGRLGLELSYDEQLKGYPLVASGLKIRGGGTSYILDFPDLRPTGNTIVLSLDTKIQAILEDTLTSALKRYQARWGLIIVEDVQTGEILGMAQAPLFNPNATSTYTGDEASYRRNRALVERFEPGSVLKPFIIAAAMEEGEFDPDEVYDLEDGEWKLHGVTIKDSHPMAKCEGKYLLKYSSNIGLGKIGVERLGKHRVIRYLRDFGFGERLGVDPRLEASGRIRSAASTHDVDLANICFGQGVSVTPIQLVNAFAALGNGGRLKRPILVKQIISPDGHILLNNEPKTIRQAVSAETARAVVESLIHVTEEGGTAPAAAVHQYTVAGKTGTADQPVPINHPTETRIVVRNGQEEEIPLVLGWEYSEQVWRSSFAGLVPAADPQVAILVLLADAQFDHSGGGVAAPIFAEIAPAVLRQLGIQPEASPVHEILAETSEAPVSARTHAAPSFGDGEVPTIIEGRTLVPDFSGLTVSRSMEIARERRIELKPVGAGRAVYQRPTSDTLVPDNTPVVVTFRLDGQHGTEVPR
ncbi:MAG: penicillin-binding transpeptidase domain-containing protein [Pseudomonadota bacterium]